MYDQRPRPRAFFVRPLLLLSLSSVVGLTALPSHAQDSPPTTSTAPNAPPISPPSANNDAPPEPIQGTVSLSQNFTIQPDPSANSDATPKATPGSPLTLTLTVQHPTGTLVSLPPDLSFGRFELLSTERPPPPPPTNPPPETQTQTLTLTFAAYRPGRHILPSFPIQVMDAEGRLTERKTDPIEVRVYSVLEDAKDPSMPALRNPVSVLYENWTLVTILGVLLTLLVGLGLGMWIRKKLAPPPAPPPGPPPRPAYDVAIEKLRALEEENLTEHGEYEAFYVRLSEVLREYLGRRYNLSLTDQAGLELTTTELVSLLRDITWPKGVTLIDVEAFLSDCDMVKFARYTPTDSECETLLKDAFHIVETTRTPLLPPKISITETGDVSKRPQPPEDADTHEHPPQTEEDA